MTKNEQNRVLAWRLKLLREASMMPRNVAQACRHFGLSRKTFYKWQTRYKSHGEAGLCDRPRVPLSCPRATPRERVDKLARHSDAEAQLAKLKASVGDAAAYQYAEVYAQWGDAPKALEWLEKALRLRDPGLSDLKVDPLLDPLRKEPRFQAVMRELKFPT